MKVEEFSFQNFRNLIDDRFIPSPKLNIIYGNNAQGKTNLIEAMWLFTGGKSFRGAKDKELIKIGIENKKLELNMKFFSENRNQKANISIANNNTKKRNLILNDINKKSITEIIGKFCAVVFSPIHLSLVKEGPGNRRKFIDSAICQIKPTYIYTLSEYNKILMQRNTLLKDLKYNYDLIDTLDIWNIKLAQIGSIIISERINYCDSLLKYAKEIYSGISNNKEFIDLKYKTCVESESKSEIQNELLDKINTSVKEDIFLGFTTKGPHRDDIEILINKLSAKSFASQGQQRSAVLALKLSEAKILKNQIGESPVIFLDDVMSELDLSRQNYLSNNIKDFQTFVTCCDPTVLNIKCESKLFNINKGKIM